MKNRTENGSVVSFVQGTKGGVPAEAHEKTLQSDFGGVYTTASC